MNVLIIEDEKAAARNLQALITDVAPMTKVLSVIDSVSDAIEWLRSHKMPDIVFADIHLADGSAFEIFEHIDVTAAVIFTTAYDEYALKAFKVNSVDYLLKPISSKELTAAFSKCERLRGGGENDNNQLESLIKLFSNQKKIITHFLVPGGGDKLYPLSTSSIVYFSIENGVVMALSDNGKYYTMQHSLDELSNMVDPNRFFRANRQYIISREGVKDIDLWFYNRLSINLKDGKKIIISKQKVAQFKDWFGGSQ